MGRLTSGRRRAFAIRGVGRKRRPLDLTGCRGFSETGGCQGGADERKSRTRGQQAAQVERRASWRGGGADRQTGSVPAGVFVPR